MLLDYFLFAITDVFIVIHVVGVWQACTDVFKVYNISLSVSVATLWKQQEHGNMKVFVRVWQAGVHHDLQSETRQSNRNELK